MKTTTDSQGIAAIIAALSKIHVRPFGTESSDPKYNAQRNLNGKTHYVDDDTLRFHKSRVLSAHCLHGGLLFRIVCSDAMDMHNTKRGFRAVVHDVFGTTVSRCDLEHASKTKAAAINVNERETIDLVEHYQKAIAEQLRRNEDTAAELRVALACLPQPKAQQEAA